MENPMSTKSSSSSPLYLYRVARRLIAALSARTVTMAAVLIAVGARVGAIYGEPPQLPLAYVDTTLPPSTGATISVSAGGNLQNALDAAQPGDVISLQAGATFTGPFTLP